VGRFSRPTLQSASLSSGVEQVETADFRMLPQALLRSSTDYNIR
jgi:hypothetical protein